MFANAANHFPLNATAVNVMATKTALYPYSNTRRSTNIPTEIKKKGMKSELPVNSMRFMSCEFVGINLFSDNPTANAPIIGSKPANSAKKALKKSIDKTKTKWLIFSPSNFLKNHLVIFGITDRTIIKKITKEISNLKVNEVSRFPAADAVMTAKRISTAVSVKMVPPTVIATGSILESPIRFTIG